MEVNSILDLGDACTGCSACASICKSGSIYMIDDKKGFDYPSINYNTCTGCNACKEVCPVFEPSYKMSKIEFKRSVYAAWSLDCGIRYNSTSGGIFSELANFILNKGGVVVGAKYNDLNAVEHCLINQHNEIIYLRQSKYIQSKINNTFKEIEIALNNDLYVLFVGTPCQCAGLKSYLSRNYDKLFVCDFICRGVNSPTVYQAYLDELEENHNSKVERVWFKNKQYGWNQFGTKIIFENGDEYFSNRDEDPFMFGFIKRNLNLYLRPSCHECVFKGIQRDVDITLADFWGVKLKTSKDDTSNGVSMILNHSKKGEWLLSAIESNIFKEEKSIEEVLPHNSSLNQSVPKSILSGVFWDKFNDMKFSELIKYIKNLGEEK
jgi:coenzyme F420-reducing hydrogenase beta subunit